MYYSIDDILAEETPIMSTFKSEVEVSSFLCSFNFWRSKTARFSKKGPGIS